MYMCSTSVVILTSFYNMAAYYGTYEWKERTHFIPNLVLINQIKLNCFQKVGSRQQFKNMIFFCIKKILIWPQTNMTIIRVTSLE